MMNFARYGNSFVAQPEPGIVYVVSYYMSSWGAYVTTPEHPEPKRIAMYGFPSPEEAEGAAEKHYMTKDSGIWP
jgi:hypothetical protein